MADITASMVKALREETSQGMMECKKALTETGGDIEAAKDLMRKKGLVKAEKKAERTTTEGLVRIRISDDATAATMVGLGCEPDFCSRNDEFQGMAEAVADLAVGSEAGEIAASDEMTQTVQQCFEKIGENMSFGRGQTIKAVGQIYAVGSGNDDEYDKRDIEYPAKGDIGVLQSGYADFGVHVSRTRRNHFGRSQLEQEPVCSNHLSLAPHIRAALQHRAAFRFIRKDIV